MPAISSSKTVHADKTACICSRRCQVTITHSNTKESKERKKTILTSKTWYAVKDVKVRTENLYNDDDDSFTSRRSLSPSANLNRSLISRLTARRRVGEELHTCNTGSLGTCKATACARAKQRPEPALGTNGGGELWTTRAQPWCRSASGSGESWGKPWIVPTRAWEGGIFYIDVSLTRAAAASG